MPARMDPITLTPERWLQLQELFGRALPLAPDARADLLLRECAQDTPLREQVMALLLTSGVDDHGELEQRIDRGGSGTIPVPDFEPEQRIGRYRIQRLIGRGGMGTVYLAARADEHYHQIVALKVMARGLFHGDVANRFRAERQILARLNHPNIARLLDGGQTDDGTPYLVMEHVEGVRIDEYIARHALGVRAILPLLQQVCAAVHYAHQNLVVHRDLKPANILVTADGVPKLLDFGIAKLLTQRGGELTAPQTRMRDRVLTPEHASPEQLRGEPIGTASDVYSLGTLFYGLLSGLHPYDIEGRPLREIERLICDSAAPPPSERLLAAAEPGTTARSRALARELRGDLDNIVLKSMHRDAERRYPSAAALAQDIQNHLDGLPVQAQPDSWRYRASKFVRRNAIGVTGIAAVVILVSTLVAFYTLRLAAERDVAERERQTAASVSDFMTDVFRRANPNETRGETVTVRAALDAAARRIDTTLQDQPELRLALMRRMSDAYNGLGLWPESRALLEKILAAQRAAHGERSIEVAQALEALGKTHHNLGQFPDAGRAFEQAWSIRMALGRDRDAEAIDLLSSSARNLRAQLRFDAAFELHRRAEALARALRPPNPRLLGVVLNDFSFTASDAGDPRSAERYAREALPLLEGVVSEGNDLYGNSLDALANALRKQFRLEESGTLYRAFVARQTQRLGRDHVLVGRVQNNFGALLRAMGDYAGAQRALEEALRIYFLHPDTNTVDIAVSSHNLGALHHESGDLVHALREINEAVSWKMKAGARSPTLVTSLVERAGILREMGKLTAAEAALVEAESIAADKLDRGDRRHTLLRLERGRFLLAAGRPREAQQELQNAVQSLRAQEDPIRVAEALASLSAALAVEAQIDEARGAATEALAIRQRLLPATHPAIAAIQSQIAKLPPTGTSITPRE